MVLGWPIFYEENQRSNLAQGHCWEGYLWSWQCLRG